MCMYKKKMDGSIWQHNYKFGGLLGPSILDVNDIIGLSRITLLYHFKTRGAA